VQGRDSKYVLDLNAGYNNTNSFLKLNCNSSLYDKTHPEQRNQVVVETFLTLTVWFFLEIFWKYPQKLSI
jgi:hypothetical protein